jgi:hypothetical protein
MTSANVPLGTSRSTTAMRDPISFIDETIFSHRRSSCMPKPPFSHKATASPVVLIMAWMYCHSAQRCYLPAYRTGQSYRFEQQLGQQTVLKDGRWYYRRKKRRGQTRGVVRSTSLYPT